MMREAPGIADLFFMSRTGPDRRDEVSEQANIFYHGGKYDIRENDGPWQEKFIHPGTL